MKSKLTYLGIVENILESMKKPLTAVEIWEEAIKEGYDKEISSYGKTPWNSISAQIYVSIRDDKNSIFYQPSKRPALFFLKRYKSLVKEEDLEVPNIEEQKTRKFSERELHPLLIKFANSDQHFKAHLRTIFHEISKKGRSGYNEWLHPDLVGVYFPFTEFNVNAIELQKTLSLSSTKIFSFEMKIELNMSNIRKYYFQAVSNSSWAHEGYLVALDINKDVDFRDELRRLSNAFGIGIIELNAENIEQSEIIFPAKTNSSLDWETINRLIDSNKDFESFIQRITKDVNGREIKREEYDVVMNDEQYQVYKNKLIY
ncbi:MAG: COG2958 family protein [Candidatus Woesearchaeota archaeon]